MSVVVWRWPLQSVLCSSPASICSLSVTTIFLLLVFHPFLSKVNRIYCRLSWCQSAAPEPQVVFEANVSCSETYQDVCCLPPERTAWPYVLKNSGAPAEVFLQPYLHYYCSYAMFIPRISTESQNDKLWCTGAHHSRWPTALIQVCVFVVHVSDSCCCI